MRSYIKCRYCRKGFPAFNVQVVVDHKLRIRSYYISPGSQNDEGVFNKSWFGKNLHKFIPQGCWFLADAGYNLSAYLLTPYKIDIGMAEDEIKYNYLNSKTRIAVERAIGLLKNKFKIFNLPCRCSGTNIQENCCLHDSS